MQRSLDAVVCGLAAQSSVRLSFDDLAGLRKQPPAVGEGPLPANLLRHADEQGVAAVAALAAAALAGPFEGWGAVAGPRFAGRLMAAWQVPRFLAEGAWGVSPHVIPHHSLHSVSGTISLALKLRGPNLGAGGGPGAELEALVAALALLEGERLPGVWLVCTRLTPEGPVGPTGVPVGPCWAEAVALALVPADSPLSRQAVTGAGLAALVRWREEAAAAPPPVGGSPALAAPVPTLSLAPELRP